VSQKPGIFREPGTAPAVIGLTIDLTASLHRVE
jgi:hypothetical protein